MPSPPPPAVASPLRVVFFGPPRSGKSKLLDAVAGVAHCKADDAVPLLPADPPIGPGGVIRRRVRVDLPGSRAATGDVEFVDCDGVAAEALLEDADQLRRAKARSELAWYVRRTDALVVVVDATWTADEVDAAFDQFRTFLKALREGRTTDREVGGLPVFLTLCKCDMLARPGEEFTDWQNRVRAEAEKVEGRFHEWFDDPVGPFLAFGSTNLAVSATATGWPQVVGGVPDDTGGFGVADLHHDLLLAAREHHDRMRNSRRRLSWTAGIAVGLLSFMLLTLVALSAARTPSAVDSLAARVRRVQADPLELRLADAHFEGNRRELMVVLEHPLFGQLPSDVQQAVTDDVRLFDVYAEYRRRFAPPQFAPADVRTAGERKELEAALTGPLSPPPTFAAAWDRTEAVRLWRKWRDDLDVLAAAEETLHAWYTAELSWLKDLQLADVPTDRWSPAAWRAAVDEAVHRHPEVKYPPEHTIPGAESLTITRGEPISYAAAYRSERVDAVATDWRQAVVRLADVRDLSDAVGFTVNPAVKDAAVLRLSPATDSDEAVGWAVGAFAALKAKYPRAAAGEAAWVMNPDAGTLQRRLGERLQELKANAVELVKRVVAADPAVKAGDWEKLAAPDGLLLKPEMAAWGELLRLLVRWADPTQPDDDPVKHLAAFVAKKEFTWEIARITVRVPSTLVVNTPSKASGLTVRVWSAKSDRTFTFAPSRPQAESNATVFEFTPKGEGGTVKYIRGDRFAAAAVLSDDSDGPLPLDWDEKLARTTDFRFEALLREPRQAAGVRVTVTVRSGSDKFRVPLLLPEVK